MFARRIGLPGQMFAGQTQGELGTEDGGHAVCSCGFREAHHAVEAVVIGQCQRIEAKTCRFFDQLFGMRRPIEEAEIRMTVQLGVGHGRRAGRRVGAGGGAW